MTECLRLAFHFFFDLTTRTCFDQATQPARRSVYEYVGSEPTKEAERGDPRQSHRASGMHSTLAIDIFIKADARNDSQDRNADRSLQVALLVK